jgi:hypothetical protein
MGISVEIDNLSNINYAEYVLTGFHLLKEKGIIDKYKINLNFNLRPIIHQIRTIRSQVNFLPKLSPINGWDHMVGRFQGGEKSVKFAVNFLDTPWNFGESHFLEEADIYFKCQYPRDFKKGFMRLSKSMNIDVPVDVMKSGYKVRPLMLGRPLSRVLSFKTNEKLLTKYAKKRKDANRKYSSLVYFGMAYDDINITNTHHPHLKRADIAVFASKNIPKAKVIFNLSKEERFLRQLTPEALAMGSSERISDEMYLDMIQSSFSTINITGLRGSIPWRVIDSFLSGMVLISDNFNVDWYEPFIVGKDFLEIGDLGYNLLSEVDLNGACEKFKAYTENIEDIFKETADYRESRFNQFYSPEAIAHYMLCEAGLL